MGENPLENPEIPILDHHHFVEGPAVSSSKGPASVDLIAHLFHSKKNEQVPLAHSYHMGVFLKKKLYIRAHHPDRQDDIQILKSIF